LRQELRTGIHEIDKTDLATWLGARSSAVLA
jgi:hypothetical protein